MKPCISIIIPVYNTAPYLGKCLDSVLGQTFRDIEILCVDDLSTDDSPAILSQKAEADARLRVIRLEEKGFDCGARNRGLAESQGKYVYFMDSDDWIDPDFLEAMLRLAETSGEPVVTNANYVEEHPDTGKRSFSSRFGFVREEASFYPSRQIQSCFPPVLWERLYRRSFLLENDVRFVNVKSASDVTFTGLTTVLREKGLLFCGPYYHYVQRTDSLMKLSDRGFLDLAAFDALYDALVSRGIPRDGLKLFYIGPVILDTASKFDALRSFFLKAASDIRRNPALYVPHDLFLMESVLASPDYTAWRSRYGVSSMVAFIRSSKK